ncbi:MAG: hydrogenase maturation peptidase HycI [Candidatus Aenigmatarchaeota archaeon]|nr:MAG: hydrogenase maturation peptidase HycI [Candidatus Aenigmarchaeota archaeon]
MKTVICGVGNRMRGDDAAGPMVIDELKKTLKDNNILLLDCEHFPENFLKRILDFKPEKLILVDTADMGDKPGTFRKIDLDSVKKQALSTHKLPLTLLVNYLRSKIDFKLVFLGIQPKQRGFDEQVSGECKRAVKNISKEITEMVK